MQTFRIESVVSANRVLTLRGVPFRAGQRVEVIVLSIPRDASNGNHYPLRGKPYKFVAPFDPVAEDDWNALR